jgi:uncharacterized protein (DUF2164 family)
MKKEWERLSDEEKEIAKRDIIHYFEHERNEKIGIIASEDILNFFLENIGGILYNKGIQDSRKAVEYRLNELNYDLDDLIDNQV